MSPPYLSSGECYTGWVEPLLQRITEDSHVVALPIIEVINPDNFRFSVTSMQRVISKALSNLSINILKCLQQLLYFIFV